MVLVDSNVLIDILADDQEWREWSEARVIAASSEDELAINPIIYAEIAVAYRRKTDLEDALWDWPLHRLPLPYAAGFLAGKAFKAYRRRGGIRHAPLPDFYIGAHAATDDLILLTRDASRYRTYFPELELIAP